MSVEIAYSIDEMLKEEAVSRDEMLDDLNYIFKSLYYHPDMLVGLARSDGRLEGIPCVER